eukprot:m.233367 g.233367  ORF g.233367 m.233367 type:complete len:342 (+) comp42801_c0_seq1:187-1212(+)
MADSHASWAYTSSADDGAAPSSATPAAAPRTMRAPTDGSVFKEATFEWCMSWTELSPFLSPDVLHFPVAASNVLVPGAGTSTLAALLCTAGGYANVDAVDFDAGCTEHMRTQYRHVKGLRWITADVCSEEEMAQVVDASHYSLIVDKSTLDYVLADATQGYRAVAHYLRAMYRALAPGGILAIVSFHPPEFLSPLFSGHGQWLSCERWERTHIATQPHLPPITLMIARRPTDGSAIAPDVTALETTVAHAVAVWHTQVDPLLTDDERHRIHLAWPRDAATGLPEPTSIQHAHRILFSEALQREFPVEAFHESLEATGLLGHGDAEPCLSLEAALAFVETNQ